MTCEKKRFFLIVRKYVKTLVAMNDQAEPVYENSDSDSYGVGTDIETQVCTEKFKESAT